jgi:drug/metabolite transporter (DMT)-like permease
VTATLSPIARGAMLAVLAAVSFGATTPLVAHAGRGLGPLLTACLLYAGAFGSALVLGRLAPSSGAPVRRALVGRLLAIAVVGAGLAPALLAWGLSRTGATVGALLLNCEALFTVLLASALYREPIGARVAVALVLMLLGGGALVGGATLGGSWSALGALAVAGATAAWAVDNALTKPLATLDPMIVVATKSGLGALLTGALATALGEPLPSRRAALLLVAAGATGYGLSLRLYLLAQRRIGAARTGSIFAVAPFVGAALGWLVVGDQHAGGWSAAAALLFAAGVALHLTERHDHRHIHEAVEHDHPHRHDDGHHDHAHDPPVAGEHSHPHRHERIEHAHDHAPDLHHDHDHDHEHDHAHA